MNNYVYRNGQPVKTGICVTTDNVTQTFTIQLRSMRPIGVNDLKDLLQRKYEVVEINETDRLTVVTNTPQ